MDQVSGRTHLAKPRWIPSGFSARSSPSADFLERRARLRWEQKIASDRRQLLTTEFVLVEIADGLAAVNFRAHAARVITALRASPAVEIVPASSDLFRAAFQLYLARTDKGWGLTDCASFAVMSDRSLSEALTTDHHFQQAGFRALLLEDPTL